LRGKEFVVTTLDGCGDILVPRFVLPGATNGGRVGKVMEYPVHKALVCMESIEQIVAAARSPLDFKRIHWMLLPSFSASTSSTTSNPTASNSAESLNLANFFKPAWNWIFTTPSTTVIRDLIQDVLTTSLSRIPASESPQVSPYNSYTPYPNTPQTPSPQPASIPLELITAVKSWSMTAHTEVQSLDKVFLEKRWKELEWWKLPWRVDDVSVVAADVVKESFLPFAERDGVFLAGQVAGFSSPCSSFSLTPLSTTTTAATNPSSNYKYNTSISHTRQKIIKETIPSLHISAQRILFSAVSTNALAAVTAGMLMASGIDAFTSGSILAAGAVASAAYTQRNWNRVRRGFEESVKEMARCAVVDGERWAWGCVFGKVDGVKSVSGSESEKERGLRKSLVNGLDILKSLD
jgi:hypothetical protein